MSNEVDGSRNACGLEKVGVDRPCATVSKAGLAGIWGVHMRICVEWEETAEGYMQMQCS
jgi:hypothetical protein